MGYKKSKTNKLVLDTLVANNFRKVKLWLLIPPFILLTLIFLFFSFSGGTNFTENYVESQFHLFLFLNSKLSEYPGLQLNITHLGDALIIYPLIIVCLFYVSKFWEVLLTSSIISLIVSATLKNIFAVPRPASMFGVENFVILGKTLYGPTALPSGHSMTGFIVVTILMFAYMPKKHLLKLIWSLLMLVLGFIIAFSRVGVGAHYPFDVIIGSTIGFIVAIIGIKLNNNFSWLNWIKNKRFYPVFILLFLVWSFLIVNRIVDHNLPVFYLSLLSLVVTLFFITNAYIKKN